MSHELSVTRVADLLHNPTHRMPIALCLDSSYSMSGDPIRELNEGVNLFFDAVREEPMALAAAEVAIVVFSERAHTVLDFQGLMRVERVPQITAMGSATDLGAGVNLSLDLLEKRKAEYRQAGVDYFQPWLVLMTDGQPTSHEHIAASQRSRQLEQHGKLVVFPIAIGDHADMTVLSLFSQKRPALRLRELRFREFFEWLSQSVVRVSQSRPGEKLGLDMDGLRGWAEI